MASVSLITSANATTNYHPFQQFNNEFNLNFGMSGATLQNSAGSQANTTSQKYGLEVERLFNNGVWFDINTNIVVNSLTNQSNGIGSGASIVNQNPNLGGINIKTGYAFDIVSDNLLLTPYGLVGRNANVAASTLYYNNNSNITNDFYYTLGMGGRLDYRINNKVDLYLDQLVGYNWDQSAPLNGVMPQNNMVYLTTLGVKYNVYKQLQIGLNGFYNFYNNMASIPQDTTGASVYVPVNSYGGAITFGLTY